MTDHTEPSNPTIHEYKDHKSVVDAVAVLVYQQLQEAIDARGRASLVIAGGSTFLPVYARFADDGDSIIDWQKVDVFFSDLRVAAPDIEEDTVGLVTSLWQPPNLEKPPIIHRPHELQTWFQDRSASWLGHSPFDVVLLSLGVDGHSASLFPVDLMKLMNHDTWAALVDARLAPLVPRVTLTPRALLHSRSVLVAATGQEKREAVHRFLTHDPSLLLSVLVEHDIPVNLFIDNQARQEGGNAGHDLVVNGV
jgi:6-phosphogluconolactonase